MDKACKTAFHDTVIRLLDYLRDNVPALKAKVISYKGLYRMVMMSDQPLRYFHEWVLPHSDHVANENNGFIAEMDIKAITGCDVGDDGHLLKSVWSGLDAKIQQDIWKYVKVLFDISVKYMTTVV
jgi:hypothetical protein